MTLTRRVVNAILHGLTGALCRVDADQISQIPERGPLILVANHVNFVEIPVLYTRMGARPLMALTKTETFDSLLMRAVFDLSRAIPVRRGKADTTAIRRASEALKTGHILTVFPEGTRSGDGRLRRGHPGVALLAVRTGAPLLPMASRGGECFWRNLPRFKRTDFHLSVGKPFNVHAESKVTHEMRQQIADEIMYQIAALLPPAYRGYYADMSRATENFLHFSDSSNSHLMTSRTREQGSPLTDAA